MKQIFFIFILAFTISCQSDHTRLQGHWHLDSQKRFTINNGDTSIWYITPEDEELGYSPPRKTRAILDINGTHAHWDNGVYGYPGIHGAYIQREDIIEIVEVDCYLETFEYHFLTEDVMELHSTNDTTIWLATRSSPHDCDRQRDFFNNSRTNIELVNSKASTLLLSDLNRSQVNLILVGKERSEFRHDTRPRIEMGGHFIVTDDIKEIGTRRLLKVPTPFRDSVKNIILFDKYSPITALPEVIKGLNEIDAEKIYLGFRKDTDLNESFDIVLEKWDGSRKFPVDLEISFKEWITCTL